MTTSSSSEGGRWRDGATLQRCELCRQREPCRTVHRLTVCPACRVEYFTFSGGGSGLLPG